MNVFKLLTSRFSSRGKALALYKSGMEHSKKRDNQSAIEDYTSAIGTPDVPPDVVAMSLYNRALVYAATGKGQKATDDLNAVIGMDAAPPNIKDEAKRKLVRMDRSAKKKDG